MQLEEEDLKEVVDLLKDLCEEDKVMWTWENNTGEKTAIKRHLSQENTLLPLLITVYLCGPE